MRKRGIINFKGLKVTNGGLFNLCGLVSCGLFVTVALMSFAPGIMVPQDVTATDGDSSLVSSLSTKTTASLASMLSIALSDSIDIDITPQSKGALGLGKARLAVTTNNTTGYSIYLSTVDGSNSLKAIDQENQYVDSETGDKKDTTYAITAMNGTTEYSKYLDNEDNLNTWGYALTKSSGESADTTIPSDTKFTGLKDTAGDSIYYTKSTTSNDTYDLNIAVAVDASLPAGGYRNGIVVSAVANPIKISGFNSIYYMQEMTSDICASAQEHEEGQLVDKRDNKIYWVGKLKDGNCWMTQNLDLDLSTDVALTPEDTNVTEEWRPEVGTRVNEFYPIDNPTNRNQWPEYSYDFGQYVTAQLDATMSCNSSIGPSTCPDYYVNVEEGYLPGFVADGGNSGVNLAEKTYDAHYLIGNVYTFSAAVTGKAKAGSQAGTVYTEDICPKNWRLPTGNSTTDNLLATEDSEFGRLFAAYGWDSYRPNSYWANFYFAETKMSSQLIYAKPLYFSLAGSVYPQALDATGNTPSIFRASTYFWSNVQYGTTTARNLQYGVTQSSQIYPAGGNFAYLAFGIRCMAK